MILFSLTSLDLVLNLVYYYDDEGRMGVRLPGRLNAMLKQVNIHEAKTHLSKLLARLKEDKEIIIAKAGKPIARLVPITGQPERRHPGSAKGKVAIAPDFDAPLPESILEKFEA
jgi:prevent-host-death family protein